MSYLLLSAVVLAIAILPWCICMGTTFPFMMAYVRQQEAQSVDSFSYLYLANVLGAMAGAVLTAVALVEIFGFHDTLSVAAAGNFTIFGISLLLALAARRGPSAGLVGTTSALPLSAAPATATPDSAGESGRFIQALLFTTGLVAMAMEVVWTRAFAPVLKTQVYSFAAVLTAYLGATFAGSWLYRRHLRRRTLGGTAQLIALLCAAAFLPVLVNDPRFVRAEYLEGGAGPAQCRRSSAQHCPVMRHPGLLDAAVSRSICRWLTSERGCRLRRQCPGLHFGAAFCLLRAAATP